jgi:hypothetical protein
MPVVLGCEVGVGAPETVGTGVGEALAVGVDFEQAAMSKDKAANTAPIARGSAPLGRAKIEGPFCHGRPGAAEV